MMFKSLLKSRSWAPLRQLSEAIQTIPAKPVTAAKIGGAQPRSTQIQTATLASTPLPIEGTESLSPDDNIFGSITGMGEEPLEPYTFPGIAAQAFPEQVVKILLSPIDPKEVEIKPDGLAYLPEIKYRRVLLRAFGPGAWALMPRSQHSLQGDTLSREYALFAYGRFISQARGEQQFFKGSSLATASEGVRSNALMRCCKDIGIASELWDPSFLIVWRAKYAVQVWVENARTKTKQRLWRRIDRPPFEYPLTEQK